MRLVDDRHHTIQYCCFIFGRAVWLVRFVGLVELVIVMRMEGGHGGRLNLRRFGEVLSRCWRRRWNDGRRMIGGRGMIGGRHRCRLIRGHRYTFVLIARRLGANLNALCIRGRIDGRGCRRRRRDYVNVLIARDIWVFRFRWALIGRHQRYAISTGWNSAGIAVIGIQIIAENVKCQLVFGFNWKINKQKRSGRDNRIK